MTDGTQGGGDGGEGGGTGAALLAGAGGGDGGGASWRDSLPDDLKSDPALANFADVASLAKGYRETKAAATARTPDYSTEAGLKSFADAVRPADATAYEIPVPDGQPSAMADAFRNFAHETGMPPAWAKATAEFFNTQSAAAIAAENDKSAKDVDTLKAKMGPAVFDQKLTAAARLLPALGVQLDDNELKQLDAKIGSANLLQFMFAVADRVGDPAPLEDAGGDSVTTLSMNPAQAQATWDARQKDPAWRAQAKIEGTEQHKEYTKLKNIITAARAASKGPGKAA